MKKFKILSCRRLDQNMYRIRYINERGNIDYIYKYAYEANHFKYKLNDKMDYILVHDDGEVAIMWKHNLYVGD